MSISHERFTYIDEYDVTIHAQRWIPSPGSNLTGPVAGDQDALDMGEALGVVQILHGVGEHSDRYDRFARELAHAGFLVYAEDHRGHGRTGLEQHGDDPAKIGKLGKGGLAGTEKAIMQLTALIRNEHPGQSVAVFAHSWGSLMAQRILNRNPKLWDAVILSGSAYRTLRHMNSGDLNRGFGARKGSDWLSRNPQTALDFDNDPRTTYVDIARAFGAVEAAKLLGTPKAAAAEVPILITSGAADPLNLHGGLALLAGAYRGLGARDVSLRLYPEGRHEMLNETNRDEFVADVLTWLTDRLVPR